LHEWRLEDLEDEKEGYNKMISYTTGERKVSFSLCMVGEELGTSARKIDGMCVHESIRQF
jgi:hypothetical protein